MLRILKDIVRFDYIVNMKLPIDKSPFSKSELNITFQEVQDFSYEELRDWIDKIRKEILDVWETNHIPPMTGKNSDEIITSFKKLKDYDLDKIWFEDENYIDYLGFIRNFTNVGSGVNQFFPHMLKTKINGKSMYDWFSNEELQTDFRRIMVRTIRNDKMYSFSRYLRDMSLEEFLKTKSDDVGFWLEQVETDTHQTSTSETFISENAIRYTKGLQDRDFRNTLDYVDTMGYKVRVYDKNQRVFPNIIQIFRLSLGQPPVNFPPLTARLIYEKYLGGLNQDEYIVYDMCSGWGGRLLGSLSSQLKIHYVGTDVNSNNKGCYESLGNFYNDNCNGTNTFEMFDVGCEVIDTHKRFKKYKGKLDLCFTSPPYFDREQYSDDKEQSYIKYPNYDDWVNGFLSDTIRICSEYLKPKRYMIMNIADIKIGENRFLPIEQSTIQLALNHNFKYIGKLGMSMVRMIGLNPKDVRNNWFDETTMKDYKTEPILIFEKQ